MRLAVVAGIVFCLARAPVTFSQASSGKAAASRADMQGYCWGWRASVAEDGNWLARRNCSQ